jgi:hypothetical protein
LDAYCQLYDESQRTRGRNHKRALVQRNFYAAEQIYRIRHIASALTVPNAVQAQSFLLCFCSFNEATGSWQMRWVRTSHHPLSPYLSRDFLILLIIAVSTSKPIVSKHKSAFKKGAQNPRSPLRREYSTSKLSVHRGGFSRFARERLVREPIDFAIFETWGQYRKNNARQDRICW